MMIFLLMTAFVDRGPIVPPMPPVPPVPPITEMCLSVTSYWVWDKNGLIYDGFHGQCDEDCSTTGGLYSLPALSLNYTEKYAACISSWTARKGNPTAHIDVAGDVYACVDSFGDESYRRPIYRDWKWRIPIDLLHPNQHGIVCDWSRSWKRVNDKLNPLEDVLEVQDD